jgi:hypothetical protein
MGGIFTWHWQIPLSLFTPAAVALAICLLEAKGPLSSVLQSGKGLVPPYFGAIAILFGLFTALLTSDVWQKDNAARQSVQMESDALQGIVHLARANGLQDALLPHVKAYIQAASREDPYSHTIDAARGATASALEAMQASIVQANRLDSSGRSALLSASSDLRRAHDRRLYVANDSTAPIKWLSILVLGALTQIAIMLVHIGNRSALRLGVGLFTVAFTFCLVIVAVFDLPFEIVLSHEPRTSLERVLAGL